MKLMGITDHLRIISVTRIVRCVPRELEESHVAIVAVARTQKQASEIHHNTQRCGQDVMLNDSQEDMNHQ